jgi:hypothetical protein
LQGGSLILDNAAISLIYQQYQSVGDVKLSLSDVAITGSANTMLIQSNLSNAYVLTITAIKSGGTMAGGIEGRSDKGIAVPASWIIKQII